MSFRKTHKEIILEEVQVQARNLISVVLIALIARTPFFAARFMFTLICFVHKKSVRTTHEESQGKLDKRAAGRQQCFSGIKIQQTLIQR